VVPRRGSVTWERSGLPADRTKRGSCGTISSTIREGGNGTACGWVFGAEVGTERRGRVY